MQRSVSVPADRAERRAQRHAEADRLWHRSSKPFTGTEKQQERINWANEVSKELTVTFNSSVVVYGWASFAVWAEYEVIDSISCAFSDFSFCFECVWQLVFAVLRELEIGTDWSHINETCEVHSWTNSNKQWWKSCKYCFGSSYLWQNMVRFQYIVL